MPSSDIEKVAEYGSFLNDIRKQFLENYREEFSQLIQYVQVLMGTLGVLAGFGFTAFQFIHSLILFFTGEALVVLSIFYLIYKTQIYITGQPISTENWLNKSVGKIKEIKTAILANNETDLKRLADEFAGDVNDVSQELPPFEASKIISSSIKSAFWIGIVGICLIFLSFLICF